MRLRHYSSLPLAGLLVLGIAPQARGEMPQDQGRRPTPMPGSRSEINPGPGPIQRPGTGPEARPGRPSLPAAPAGRPPIMRPTYSRLGPTASFAYLPVFARCTVLPTSAYWRNRDYDIMAAIQRESRRGFIPVTPYPVDQDSVTGTSMVASGWRAYGFVVPPGGQVQLKLSHPKPGWFRVYWVDQWGEYRPGMMIKPGEPEALYTNQGKKTMAVYAVVDDPGQWATPTDPFTLSVKRNFDAAHMDTDGVSVHQGIWNIAAESYWLSPEHR
ncbi:MAG TPA: hypothetical protein VNV60_12570 [Holophagaceae bacterium]|nr:hypothetical protein [Holophagaceae bacterium]